MRILVIGGGGFIGQRVVVALAGRGCSLVSMDLAGGLPDDLPTGASVHQERGDVTRFDDLTRVISQTRPDAIINLAYLLTEGEKTPHLATRLNVTGIDNTFEAARLAGIKRVVFASSIAWHGAKQSIYGDRQLDETEPPVSGAVYTSCKQFNEAMAAVYNRVYGLEAVAIRPCYVIGAGKIGGMQEHLRVITNPARGEPVRSRMRSSAVYLLGHVEDIAELFVRATLAPELRHRVYHSGGRRTSLGELADLVREFIPDADLEFDEETGWDSYLVNRVDHGRARQEFAFEHRPLRQTVREIINGVRTRAGLEPL